MTQPLQPAFVSNVIDLTIITQATAEISIRDVVEMLDLPRDAKYGAKTLRMERDSR